MIINVFSFSLEFFSFVTISFMKNRTKWEVGRRGRDNRRKRKEGRQETRKEGERVVGYQM